MSSILRSNQAWCELLSEKHTLAGGIAFCSDEWSDLPGVNQFREVLIPDPADIPDAFAEAERFFDERGLFCSCWAPAAEQPTDEMGRYLEGLGFRRRQTLAMLLDHWPALSPGADCRVLPARAMREAYRQTFELDPSAGERQADAANERLDEASLTAVVAVADGQPVGRAGLFEVGDIGRIVDVHVVDGARRRGVGTALLAQVLELAKRSDSRLICAQVDADNTGMIRFLERCGLQADGGICEFDAPPSK